MLKGDNTYFVIIDNNRYMYIFTFCKVINHKFK